MTECRICDFIPSPVITVGNNGVGHGVARIARGGIYLYLLEELKAHKIGIPDGYNKALAPVLKPPESVKETAQLFDSIPLTIQHNWITPENHHLIKGWGGEISYVNGWLETSAVLEADAVKAYYEKGLTSFSTGQRADVNYSPGVWIDADGIMGEQGKSYEYDFILIPLEGNHLALVDKSVARAGLGSVNKPGFIQDSMPYDGIIYFNGLKLMDKIPDGMIPMKIGDMSGHVTKDMSPVLMDLFKAIGDMFSGSKSEDMMPVSLGDASYSIPKKMKDMLGKHQDSLIESGKQQVTDSMGYVLAKNYKDLEEQLTTTKQSVVTLQSKNIELSNRLNDATDPTKIDNIIQERSDSFKQASPFLGDTDFDPSVTAIDWKKQALLKGGHDQVTLDSFSEDQVMAAFATLTTITPKTPDTSNQISDRIAKYRQSQGTGGKTSATDILPQNRKIPSII